MAGAKSSTACPMIDVCELDRAQENEYVAWLQHLSTSMVYYTPAFRRFLEAAVGAEGTTLLALRAGRIVGALPYLKREVKALGAVFNSQPWYGSHGGCMLADFSDEAVRDALLAAYRSAVRASDWIGSTVILSLEEHQRAEIYARALGAVAHDARIGQVTELPLAGPGLEPELERVMQQKTRNLVRKARKQGFRETVCDEDWAWRFLHETHVENMRAIGGKPKPETHFEALRSMLPPDMRRVSVALAGGTPVAALLLVLFNRTVEYVTPVIAHDWRSRQPLSFLIWEAMLDACRRGFRRWNWGGTWLGQTSLHHFKAGFGARDYPYSYQISLSDRGRHLLENARDALFAAFPYFYVYPLSALAR